MLSSKAQTDSQLNIINVAHSVSWGTFGRPNLPHVVCPNMPHLVIMSLLINFVQNQLNENTTTL